MNTTIEMNLFSPRWGHEDIYTVLLEENTMTISTDGKKATCELQTDKDPIWSKNSGTDSLDKMLINNHIYLPEIFKSLLVCAWKSWLDKELNDSEVKDEFHELEKWINVIVRKRPNSEYWNTKF